MSTMKCIRIRRFGGPEVLEPGEVERPTPSAGELLIRLAATSVNPVDFKSRQGKFPPVSQDKLPVVLGRDVAGVVEALGDGVLDVSVGDAVYGMPTFERGTYAQYAVLKTNEAAKAPATLEPGVAGAVPLAALTAWQGLFDHGGLVAGQRVLIHGGAGGVGHFAVQFAHAEGAVVATTGSEADLDYLRGLGADMAIDYKAERFEEVLGPVDLVLDLIGGETLARSFLVLKPGGVLMSTLEEPDPDRAKALGARGERYMTKPNGGDLARIAELIDAAQVKVTITHRFTLDRVADAQARLEKGGVRGKILVTVD